jgi:hypothetical protein
MARTKGTIGDRSGQTQLAGQDVARPKKSGVRRGARRGARRGQDVDNFVYYDEVINSNKKTKTSTVHVPFPDGRNIHVWTEDIPTYMLEPKYKKHFTPLTRDDWDNYKLSEEYTDHTRYFLQKKDDEDFSEKTSDQIRAYLDELPDE